MNFRQPRYPLGCFPTPMHDLENIGRVLGIDLRIKREDLSGLAAGGNKVRKLEYLIGDAKAQQATVLITAGALQSNHVLQTVAAARKADMRVIAVVPGPRPGKFLGNLFFDQLLGAEIEFLATDKFFEEVAGYMSHRQRELAERGEHAYVVPVGGSNALGSLGYVACAYEMASQYASSGLGSPDYVVVVTGSVGMYAGLVAGCSDIWPQTKVLGVVVNQYPFSRRENVAQMTNEVARLANIQRQWKADELHLDYDYVGPGYGIRSRAGDSAIHLVGQKEGILLDPIYTGKAFAGLIGNVRSGVIQPGSRVLFVHSGGAIANLVD